MGGLLVAFVISFTAVTVILIGILAAYAVVNGILYAFNYRSRRRVNVPAGVLVPSQASSGD